MAQHIQINDVVPRIQYVADGTSTSFTFPFAIFTPADLEVLMATSLVTSGFTVHGAGDSHGGTCVFVVAPAAGTVLTLRRRLAIRRNSDFQENGELRASVLNDELDYQIAAIQQLADDATRTLQLDPSDPPSTPVLPPRAERVNRILGFGADGMPAMFDAGSGIGLAENVLFNPGAAAGTGTVAAKLSETLSVRDFGAVGDGLTDDTLAIQAAFDAAALRVASVLIPDGIYRTTATVVLAPEAFALAMRGEILFAGSGTALRIGNPGATRLWGRRYHGIRVRRATLSDWSSEAEIGVAIYNAYACDITIEHAEGFTIGAQAFGDGVGWVYCRVGLGRLFNNKVGLDLRCGVDGWNNQNTFIGGTFQMATATNPTRERYGVRFSRTGPTAYDSHNNNVFLNPSFELKAVVDWWPNTAYVLNQRIRGAAGRIYTCIQAGTSGTLAPAGNAAGIIDGTARWDFTQDSHDCVSVLMEVSGRANRFIGARNEGSGRAVARELRDAMSNSYDFAFVGGQGAAGNAIGGHFVEAAGNLAGSVLSISNGFDRFAAADQPLKLVWAAPDLRRAANPYDATRIFVQGCSLIATSPLPERRLNTFRQLSSFELRSNSIRVPSSSRGIGTCVDTRAAKRFLFAHALDGQPQAGRMLIRCFDADDRLITTGTPVRASRGLTFLSSLGGFLTGFETFAPLYFEVDASVATVWAGITGSSAGPADVTALRLYCVEAHAPRAFPGHGEDDPGAIAIAISAPSFGTHDAFAVYRNVAATGPAYWECTSAGTFGTLVGVTGTTMAGSSALFLANTGSLAVGEWVGVPGAFTVASVASFQRLDAATQAPWAPATSYLAGAVVGRGGVAYVCTTSGISGATGPTGSGNGIVDGACTWNAVAARLTMSASATGAVSGAAVGYVSPAFAARART
jgi:hypothetical protein